MSSGYDSTPISTSGESNRVKNARVGPGVAQSLAFPVGGAELVQSQEFKHQSRVTFDAYAGPSPVDLEGEEEEEEEEDDRDSLVFASPVLDKAFTRLIDFVYGRYPESRPLSPPYHPSRCGFESLFTMSDPPELSRPRLRLYSRVSEIINQTQEHSARLARE